MIKTVLLVLFFTAVVNAGAVSMAQGCSTADVESQFSHNGLEALDVESTFKGAWLNVRETYATFGDSSVWW